jgi:CRISPR-associated protein Cas2
MALSGYRLMWMMVLFDLPTLTTKERRAATGFRNFLLDQGFEMAQYSVYMRFCAGKEQVETHAERIRKNLPATGKVSILGFTDKQYERMIRFDGRKQEPEQKNPGQYVLL